jgi:ABC-type bacteriocin/lantibiotic exporter with double-glycine peptidase domain
MGYYKKSSKIYLRFLGFLKPYWLVGVVAGTLMIISALLQIPLPLLTKYLIDTIVPAKDLGSLNLFALLLVGVVAIKNLIDYYQNRLLINYRNQVEADIRSLLFKKILKARTGLLEKLKVGYIESRISSDVSAVGSLFLETILGLIINFLTFCVGVALCFYLNAELAIVSLISLPIFIISYHAFSKRMNQLTKINQEKWASLRGNAVEYITQSNVIKVFNKAKTIIQVYVHCLNEAIQSNKKLQLLNLVSGIVIGITAVVLPLFVLWYGVRQIIMGQFTLGGFIAFNTCIDYLYNPVKSFVSININIHAALAAAERIFEVLDYEEETSQFGHVRLQEIRSIQMENVYYYYNAQEKRGVENVSLHLDKGKKLAIIGETGKGKSTIARLILGVDVPREGRILINRKEYREYDIHALRDHIAYIPQEPSLFSGSILDNMLFFSESPDKSTLEQILHWCVLEDTIKRFPMGLDTNVFEAGTGLSGGEKQRIAIARAVLRKTDIIIFDEATSAIDPETEKILVPNMLALPWQPGIILISHRYAHLGKFDSVLNLNSPESSGMSVVNG